MMKKNELMNGDIVVLSSGSVAVVIGEGEDAYLLYQYGGFEFLDDYYDDDLYNETDDDMVMQVFRPDGRFGLEGVDQEIPVWERDNAWECPCEKQREEQHRAAMERHEAEWKADLERMAQARKDMIFIVAQGFYGNRTGTEIRRGEVDYFLKGILNPKLFPGEDKSVDRRIVPVPGSDGLVIVYDQNQEDEYMNVTFPERVAAHSAEYFENTGREMRPWVSCTIPEIGLELHTRCFACRMDESGSFQSLEDGDGDAFVKYFPEK